MTLLQPATDVLSVEARTVWKVVRKIFNIMPLFPTGKFNINHLIRANCELVKRRYLVAITPALKRQLFF